MIGQMKPSAHHRTRRQGSLPRDRWDRRRTFELVVTVLVIIAVLATLAIFLLGYHDFPFRLSGP